MAETKKHISQLAILGGKPLFSTLLHVGKPSLIDRDYFLKEVNGILDREYYTNGGPVLEEFEARIASFTEVKHCVAVCNGTKALEISARALGLSGEVIVPAFTFIATAHSLYWQGITPVFCDIEEQTHQIDVEKIESLITPRTTGILAVHLWGIPCNIEKLERLAEKYRIKLIFDASHAFGSMYNGLSACNFGDASAISFHATKMIQTFEGGAILTNDDRLAEQARLMTNFGFVGYDEVSCIGTNGKMSEVHAAMGLTCLHNLEKTLQAYTVRYEYYQKALAGLDCVRLIPHIEGSNRQYIVVEVTDSVLDSRDLLCDILQMEGVIARKYFYPGCHKMAPYNMFPNRPDLPVTDLVASRVLVLPSGPAVSRESIDGIASIIKLGLEGSKSIKEAQNQ